MEMQNQAMTGPSSSGCSLNDTGIESIRRTTREAIEEFSPSMPQSRWRVIRPAVSDIVERVESGSAKQAASLMGTVAVYVDWCRTRGEALDDELFSIERIEAFTADRPVKTWAPCTYATRRSELLFVANALHGVAGSGRLESVDRRTKAAPYNSAEIGALRDWRRRQKTLQRRIDLGVLLALGLGAGLSGGEIVDVVASDIIDTDSVGLSVVVADRIVPLVARYEVLVRPALSAREPDQRLFGGRTDRGGKNQISNFLARCSHIDPVLSTHRMRTTWLVGRLNAGVPIKELMAAAGLDSLRSVNECMAWVDAGDPAESDQLLRRGRTTGGHKR